MERYRSDSERKTANRKQHSQGHQSFTFTKRGLDDRQIRRSAKPIEITDTQQKETGCKGAEQKILQGCFGSRVVGFDDPQEDVGWDAHEFQSQEHRD